MDDPVEAVQSCVPLQPCVYIVGIVPSLSLDVSRCDLKLDEIQ